MDATTLAARQKVREAEGRPESLTELRDRMEFAYDWNAKRADKAGRWAHEAREARDEWMIGYWTGRTLAERDAARMIESFVQALDVLIGGD